ncbi:hypothetical protein [Streptomyces sp. NPDC088180]|uniref:hypothetical protein n=1 Tax=Streptomyces sp. NPDC088180 TaxID=3365837 RepID=UPI003803485C
MGGATVVGQPDDVWGRPGATAEPAGAAEGGDLRHSGGPWLRAAGAADQLVTHLGPVKGELEAAHRGLVAGALDALGAVRASWERRIKWQTPPVARLPPLREGLELIPRPNIHSDFWSAGAPEGAARGS